MTVRTPTRLLSVAAATLVLVATSCGGDGGGQAATTTTERPKDHPPCSLLTASEVTAETGTTVGDGAESEAGDVPPGKAAACAWTASGGGSAGDVALAVAVHEWRDVPDSFKRQEKAELADAASYVRWFCRQLEDTKGGDGAGAENVLLNFDGVPGCSSGNTTLVAVPSTLVVLEAPADQVSEAARRSTQRLAAVLAPRL